jgi:hypothetical protein
MLSNLSGFDPKISNAKLLAATPMSLPIGTQHWVKSIKIKWHDVPFHDSCMETEATYIYSIYI